MKRTYVAKAVLVLRRSQCKIVVDVVIYERRDRTAKHDRRRMLPVFRLVLKMTLLDGLLGCRLPNVIKGA
jgi:hypothetical protein